MKRNGMCPICYIKKLFTKPSRVGDIAITEKYNNGVALTPPMGWSSWNCFKNQINQDVIYDTAVAMKEKGLVEAGYTYLNLDDNWHSSLRDAAGNLQSDMVKFSDGIPSLVNKINALGIKVGIYSSNGTHTCEDLPASLYNEARDAYTFAKWGIEYFKYDYCHHEYISSYAPLIYGIFIGKVGSGKEEFYPCNDAEVSGTARKMHCDKMPNKLYVSGLDACMGAMEYKIDIEDAGEYVLTLGVKKKGSYTKAIIASINGSDGVMYDIPKQATWNHIARFQQVVTLKKGQNVIKLYNPIKTHADSAMWQYINMGKALKKATERVAKENNAPIKPIVYSLCEWGVNEPHKWGVAAGNLWRTTYDIMPQWWRIMQIYEHNVKLHQYAGIGGWNDPDMLEVGNGKLSVNENIAHFSLWCMMASPLILGNDLRVIPDKVLNIVTNKAMIAIDQDALGKQAKRIVSGDIDVLIKPLTDDRVAICVFNKSLLTRKYTVNIDNVLNDEYVNIKRGNSYNVVDVWAERYDVADKEITAELESHSVKVFIVSAVEK